MDFGDTRVASTVRWLVAAFLVTAALAAAAGAQEWRPAGTRDGIVLQYRDDESHDAREVRAVAELPHAADREPVRPGTVRMPLLRGSWQVERLDDSRSRVVYQVMVRPGGRVPRWLVRRGALDALPDIIARISRRLSGLG